MGLIKSDTNINCAGEDQQQLTLPNFLLFVLFVYSFCLIDFTLMFDIRTMCWQNYWHLHLHLRCWKAESVSLNLWDRPRLMRYSRFCITVEITFLTLLVALWSQLTYSTPP
jgi:hypothetical protein